MSWTDSYLSALAICLFSRSCQTQSPQVEKENKTILYRTVWFDIKYIWSHWCYVSISTNILSRWVRIRSKTYNFNHFTDSNTRQYYLQYVWKSGGRTPSFMPHPLIEYDKVHFFKWWVWHEGVSPAPLFLHVL